jgi:enhancer of polycomb-like protein
MSRGMRERKLDTYKPLPIVLQQESDAAYYYLDDSHTHTARVSLTAEDVAAPTKSATKKSLNIPVPFVVPTEDYDSRVRPKFVEPASYVRHYPHAPPKGAEYVLEEEDRQFVEAQVSQRQAAEAAANATVQARSRAAASAGPAAVAAAICTPGNMEHMLDLMERETSHGAPISRAEAEESFVKNLGLQRAPGFREIVGDIHEYWLEKRERIHKPLLRKYWPQTSAADANPHHVFRPRDKERCVKGAVVLMAVVVAVLD